MTLGSVFHWLDRDAFLAEAHRVLNPEGHLLIYDSLFAAEMTGNPDFTVWHTEHRKRFPPPAFKRQELLETVDASQAGFEWSVTERFDHEVEFTPQALKSYLVSQSNAAADPEDVSVWLKASVPGLFLGRESADFRFQAAIAYLRRLP